MKKGVPISATELFPDGLGSEAFQMGRMATLEFSGDEVPVLHKIQYRPTRKEEPVFWEQGHSTQDFEWNKVAQALSMLFIDYVVWDKSGQTGKFYFSGSCRKSHAASLGDAINSGGPIQELFVGEPAPGKPAETQVKTIFRGGDNVHGRATIERDRRIAVNRNFLPPDCVEIIWQIRGKQPLRELTDLQLLGRRLRLSLGLPVPQTLEDVKVDAPKEKPTPNQEAHSQEQKKDAAPKAQTKQEQPKSQEPTLESLWADFPEFWDHARQIYFTLQMGSKPEEIYNLVPKYQEIATLERYTDFCNTVMRFACVTDGRINPDFWKIPESEYEWPDDMTVWTVDGEPMTLEDVTQGTMVLGATGSGKSTCSGRTLAMSFLAKQFGGMILTTKPGEAEEWAILCDAMGRSDQIRYIRIDGPLKLNLLDYEAQRPGKGAELTQNLIEFFRVLLSVIGYRHRQQMNEGFWQQTGNQLLRNLFEVFLIAKAPMSLDRISEFVGAAPDKRSDADEAWREIPLFGELLSAAEDSAVEEMDRSAVKRLKYYWLVGFPDVPPETRGCVKIAFSAMLDVMRQRYIYELLSTDTTITPECIFRGHIIIIDLPVKEFGDAGVLVQCAFKYLFQRAIERRKNLGSQTRPAFLFIDEAQHFFTEYDTVFQQTARSSRVATVLLSQNINNFYAHLGGDKNAQYLFNSLAGNLNTRIFHANGDFLSNDWASKMFGTWDKPVSSISATSPHHETSSPFNSSEPRYTHGASTRNELLVQPGDFAKLRSANKRNGYQSDAYIYRVGSLFQRTGLPFIKGVFAQTRIIEKKEEPKDEQKEKPKGA